MERRALTQAELSQALAELPGWEVVDGKLHKRYTFGSFAEAIGWMVAAAIQADKLDHHPDWSNSYKKVTVSLMTHDLKALSGLDVELARHMEKLAERQGATKKSA
ncbi:MAG: 4a-hydroxytetrahydrobiopterin dehydratase [Candidatus Promineifilaceae bacterium]